MTCIGGSGGGSANSGFGWLLSAAGSCSEDELGFEAAARTAKKGLAFLLLWNVARSCNSGNCMTASLSRNMQ